MHACRAACKRNRERLRTVLRRIERDTGGPCHCRSIMGGVVGCGARDPNPCCTKPRSSRRRAVMSQACARLPRRAVPCSVAPDLYPAELVAGDDISAVLRVAERRDVRAVVFGRVLVDAREALAREDVGDLLGGGRGGKGRGDEGRLPERMLETCLIAIERSSSGVRPGELRRRRRRWWRRRRRRRQRLRQRLRRCA